MLFNIIEQVYKFKLIFPSWLKMKPLNSYQSRSNGEKVYLIIKPDAIGDYVLFRNFIEAYKEKKDGKVILMGNSLWMPLAEKLDKAYVDLFLPIDRKKFIGDHIYRQELLHKLSAYSIQEVIYPVYSRQFEVDYFISKINAPSKISFLGDASNRLWFQKKKANRGYTKLIEVEKNVHEFDRNKSFFEQVTQKHFSFFLPELELSTEEKNYVVLAPGASSKLRMWSWKKYSEIVNYIIENSTLEIYLVGSPQEATLIRQILEAVNDKQRVKDRTGRSLAEALEDIAMAKLFIGNETGTVHIAIALKKKLVCISNGNHYLRFNPYFNFPKALYIYPVNFSEKTLTKSGRSYLNINSIEVRTVQKVIDKILS